MIAGSFVATSGGSAARSEIKGEAPSLASASTATLPPPASESEALRRGLEKAQMDSKEAEIKLDPASLDLTNHSLSEILTGIRAKGTMIPKEGYYSCILIRPLQDVVVDDKKPAIRIVFKQSVSTSYISAENYNGPGTFGAYPLDSTDELSETELANLSEYAKKTKNIYALLALGDIFSKKSTHDKEALDYYQIAANSKENCWYALARIAEILSYRDPLKSIELSHEVVEKGFQEIELYNFFRSLIRGCCERLVAFHSSKPSGKALGHMPDPLKAVKYAKKAILIESYDKLPSLETSMQLLKKIIGRMHSDSTTPEQKLVMQFHFTASLLSKVFSKTATFNHTDIKNLIDTEIKNFDCVAAKNINLFAELLLNECSPIETKNNEHSPMETENFLNRKTFSLLKPPTKFAIFEQANQLLHLSIGQKTKFPGTLINLILEYANGPYVQEAHYFLLLLYNFREALAHPATFSPAQRANAEKLRSIIHKLDLMHHSAREQIMPSKEDYVKAIKEIVCEASTTMHETPRDTGFHFFKKPKCLIETIRNVLHSALPREYLAYITHLLETDVAEARQKRRP